MTWASSYVRSSTSGSESIAERKEMIPRHLRQSVKSATSYSESPRWTISLSSATNRTRRSVTSRGMTSCLLIIEIPSSGESRRQSVMLMQRKNLIRILLTAGENFSAQCVESPIQRSDTTTRISSARWKSISPGDEPDSDDKDNRCKCNS